MQVLFNRPVALPSATDLGRIGRRYRDFLTRKPLRDVAIGTARLLARPLPDRAYLTLGHLLYLGRWPNLAEPRTFNEHIHEYMLRCRDPLLRVAADKIQCRQYLIERGLGNHLVPLLGLWDTVDAVPLASLARPCVLKPTAASGQVLVLRPGDDRSPRELRSILRDWVRRDYSRLHREWAYAGLPRRIIGEVMLVDPGGDSAPTDCKAYVIGGAVRYFHVDRGRFGRPTRNLYAPDWTLIPARWSLENHPPDPCPPRLEEMIALAEEVARPFEFLRVDFYCVDGKIYIGELTNYPGGGFDKFIPGGYSDTMGAYWKRPGG